ncbi:MAG: glutamine--tRNA ligase/YqeY domain fusion protein [Candidatus Omnitrophica bacterium]|jgi:glutaminyl-tRNA synthetase|nr:glutamine--tRNA ligase/YqeY domain fusion protein [Candidatus Omnitrophota bacterium]
MKPNFITEIIDEHNKTGRFAARVHTRFPPEPNGYLHIGHAKAIYANYAIAKQYNGKFNLRFDDTNPCKEEQEYVNSIIEDVLWLGADYQDRIFYASDYFEQMYNYAAALIKKGKAYVCDLNAEKIREFRGTLTAPGKDSPYRNRSAEENLDLFTRMRSGEFPDGAKTLRAKIDMAHPNLNLRDPIMYRILHSSHHRTKDTWCIYPTYDWAHGLEDSIENITHSICTLEFENHRPLYDWFIDQLGIFHPQQIEFARLNITYTVLSKRKLLELVEGNFVSGWDDPRMPTIAGLRRRGYPKEALYNFCEEIGVAKFNSTIDVGVLEESVRGILNKTATRVMAVLRPLKIIVKNYPEGKFEELEAVNNPEDVSMGSRKIFFSREIYIEQEDFRENPPKEFFRLSPGREVRLRYAYFLKCEEVIKGKDGNIVELICSYDPQTRGGNAPDGRKVKATIHWVSAAKSFDAQVNLYDRLFNNPDPENVGGGGDFKSNINPHSLEIIKNAKLEPALKEALPGQRYQFERLGYFCLDTKSSGQNLIFNRISTLRDAWAKIAHKFKK